MRIVVAPDKFKGSLSALAAAQAIVRGLHRALPDAQCETVPVADGGDGTAQTLVAALGGELVACEVQGPDGRPVTARYGSLHEGTVAVIEMAQASGLALVPAGENDPLTATTFGTGQLIGDAIDRGARRIILGLGGSATNDAGTGALAALGAVFRDARGNVLPRGGAALGDLHAIETGKLEERLAGVRMEIAGDVRNPLCGPMGASAVYGPQKGASPADVRLLDAALARFATVAAAMTGADVRDIPGAGAAGGTGAGFLSLAHATLRPGAQLVLELLDFDRRLSGTQLVVTGEGKFDRQTLSGKAPHAVALAARAHGIPVVAIAGSVDCSSADLEESGIAFVLPIVASPMPIEEAMRKADALVADTAERLGRALRVGATLAREL